MHRRPYDQYKIVADAAEGTQEPTTALKVLRRAYVDRHRVWKVYDTPDSAQRAVTALRARGIPTVVYGRWWGGSWQAT